MTKKQMQEKINELEGDLNYVKNWANKAVADTQLAIDSGKYPNSNYQLINELGIFKRMVSMLERRKTNV